MNLKKCYSSIFCLIVFCHVSYGQSLDQLTVEVISQKIVKVRKGHMPGDLLVDLRFSNNSKSDVFVYGYKEKSEAEPALTVTHLDTESGLWTLPGRTAAKVFVDEPDEMFRVKRGEHVVFSVLLRRRFVDISYKTTIFATFSRKQMPFAVQSEEFVVKKAFK